MRYSTDKAVTGNRRGNYTNKQNDWLNLTAVTTTGMLNEIAPTVTKIEKRQIIVNGETTFG